MNRRHLIKTTLGAATATALPTPAPIPAPMPEGMEVFSRLRMSYDNLSSPCLAGWVPGGRTWAEHPVFGWLEAGSEDYEKHFFRRASRPSHHQPEGGGE
jgi:hypothetical protein